MKKIPTIYQRDPATNLRYVKDEQHPDAAWVFAGEGTPTYKWDGTAVLIVGTGVMFKRREVKPGKPTPPGFRQEGDPDPNTGKRVGWVVVDFDDPENKWHVKGFNNTVAELGDEPESGTYELVGPKVQGNPHQFDRHRLALHGDVDFGQQIPTGFDTLADILREGALNHSPGFEGIVWHHPDGRMAKIKASDFPKL